MKHTTLFLLLIGGLHALSFSQNDNWVPSPEYFSISYDQFDDPEAVCILDKGVLYAGDDGMILKYTGIIHVLKESGRDLGEIKLTYNKEYGTIRVKSAISYNLNEAGTVVESELAMREVIREKVGENTITVKFNIPDVRVGSVIKYRYEVQKKSVYTHNWTFQGDIPVVKSRLEFTSKESLGYSYIFLGSMADKFQFDGQRVYEMNNLPAAIEEPFAPGEGKFQPQVRLQLTEYFDYSAGRAKSVFPDWNDFGNEQLKRAEIKVSNRDLKMCAEIASGICHSSDSQEEKARKLYRYVQQKFTWNQYAGWVPDQSLKELLETKTGDAGELNRLLYALLVSVGIDAHMALVGTVDYSYVIEQYPLPTQFNVMMVSCRLGDKQYALDATDPHRQFELPAREELNGKYFILDKDNSHWETIPINRSSLRRTSGFLGIQADGTVTGTLYFNHIGYQATAARDAIDAGGIDQFWAWRLEDSFDPSYVTSYEIKGLEDPDDALTVTAEVTIPNMAMVSGDHIYLQPVLIDRVTDNPFKEDERMYPIDFSYPFKREFRVGFTLPEGYVVEEGPENGRLLYGENDMTFHYQSEQIENVYNILSLFALKRVSYPSDNIEYVRKMYDEMITRHGQQLILKKIEE